jgi:hypothetical protein
MSAHRVGAGLYVLWGLVHVVGGAAILATLQADGGAATLRMYATTAPGTVPDGVPGVAGAVAGFHAWNLLWIGALVMVIAVRYNWRNQAAGVWLNLTLAGAADAGLIAFLLLPGYMGLADAWPGLGLFVPAALLTAVGYWSARARHARGAAAPA